METIVPIRFRYSIQLAPSDLRVDFETGLLQKLQHDLEGVCSRFGYIRPGSIKIAKRSAGQFVKQHFNGHIKFDMICNADVCNPPKGAIVKATVRVKNEMGVLAESFLEVADGEQMPVLDIIVPLRAAGITSEIDLEKVNVGDEIFVSILSKRFQLNDRKISVIGKAVPGKKYTKQTIMTAQDIEDPIDVEVASNADVDYQELLPEAIEDTEEDVEGGSDDDIVGVGKDATRKAVYITDEVKAGGAGDGDGSDEEEGDAALGDEDEDEFDGEDEFEDDLDDLDEADNAGGLLSGGYLDD